jgi:iron-sulfur cluster assembly protein
MTAKIISITDSAAQRIREILSNAKDNEIKGVRVSVVTGGCAGMSYEMNYVKEINSSDEVVEDCGVKVYIDPKAIMYLLGTSMDYKKNKFSSSFVFNNPNETERCGCGESFKI